jgi:hypothetical protein
VAISIRPTLAAEPVSRKMRIEAASEVSELPMVSTNWPDHIKAKSRRLKTANGDGVWTSVPAWSVVIETRYERHPGVALGSTHLGDLRCYASMRVNALSGRGA